MAIRALEIVFHDADYDLRLLNREYGFRAHTLFDTEGPPRSSSMSREWDRRYLFFEEYFKFVWDKRY